MRARVDALGETAGTTVARRRGVKLQKILCPVDFSPASNAALETAAMLARDHGAELVVAHAWSMPAMAYEPEMVWSADIVQRLCDDAVHELDAELVRAKQLGAARASARFLTGPAWDRIVYTLEADPEIDICVVGARGRSGLAHALLGSIAENVVRHAPCSALIIPPGRPAEPFKRALCAIDFSPSAHYAAELATALVSGPEPAVTLLHVVEVPSTYRKTAGLEKPSPSVTIGAAAMLDRWAGELRHDSGPTIATRTDLGRAAERVLATLAGDRSYDLVATGSRGRTGIQRILLGSVAETIMRHAGRPVLVARRR